MATKNVPTNAAVAALMPALEALAETTPYSLAKVEHRETPVGPTVNIELPVPGTNPVTVKADVAYGSEWRVEVSGWSWKARNVHDIRLMAGVLNVAQAMVALLASIG